MYLSVVKMWDRMFNYLFADIKYPLPDGAAVGKDYFGVSDNGNDKEDDEDDEQSRSTSQSRSASKIRAKSPSVDKIMEQMLTVVREMSRACRTAGTLYSLPERCPYCVS